jgi:hypothetical protein
MRMTSSSTVTELIPQFLHQGFVVLRNLMMLDQIERILKRQVLGQVRVWSKAMLKDITGLRT